MNPNTSSSAIAPHLREAVFRAYEPLIEQAVRLWPQESAFDVPTKVASSTFLANFRNAIISLKRYRWSTTIDFAKFSAIETPRAFVINYDETGKLWFRAPRKSTATQVFTTPAQTTVEVENAIGVVPWRDWTEAELEALVLLIDKQRVNGPIQLAGKVSDTLVEHYQNLFNVALVYDAARDVTIVT